MPPILSNNIPVPPVLLSTLSATNIIQYYPSTTSIIQHFEFERFLPICRVSGRQTSKLPSCSIFPHVRSENLFFLDSSSSSSITPQFRYLVTRSKDTCRFGEKKVQLFPFVRTKTLLHLLSLPMLFSSGCRTTTATVLSVYSVYSHKLRATFKHNPLRKIQMFLPN